jgi:molybdopterin converting factor small subunit
MIIIKLQLFSILREKLPLEAKGRVELQLESGTTLVEILDELNIKRKVTISVNGVQETDKSRILNDGDEVKIFSSVSGG